MPEDEQTQEVERLTYTVEEAAKALGIGRGLAYRLVKDGTLPALRLGNRLVVPKSAVTSKVYLALEMRRSAEGDNAILRARVAELARHRAQLDRAEALLGKWDKAIGFWTSGTMHQFDKGFAQALGRCSKELAAALDLVIEWEDETDTERLRGGTRGSGEKG